MEKVRVKNISGHKVGITVSELRLNRTIEPGKEILIDKETFEESLTYPGVEELFTRKYLALLDTQEALEVGLISEEDISHTEDGDHQENIQDEKEIRKIIETGTDFQLKKLLAKESDYRKTEIANIASRIENITLSKIDIIKKETGIDLNKIIK